MIRPILSWEIPGWAAYAEVALALMETERDIESRQHSKHAIDRKIMPDLLKKRDRLFAEVAPLKAAVEAAEARLRREQVATPAIATQAATPIARATGADDLDIPAFLRRVA